MESLLSKPHDSESVLINVVSTFYGMVKPQELVFKSEIWLKSQKAKIRGLRTKQALGSKTSDFGFAGFLTVF